MSTRTIETLDDGDVVVTWEYLDYCPFPVDGMDNSPQLVRESNRYTERGAYVYRVFENGYMEQACEGLKPTGATLHSSGDGRLADVIRATLDEKE